MPQAFNPMPPPPNLEVFHVALIGAYDSQMTVSNFYYQGDMPAGTAVDDDMTALAAALIRAGSLIPVYADCCVTAWLGQQLRIWSPTNPRLVTMTSSLVPLQGTQPLPGLPTHSAVTIAKQANIRGKHGRGRISVPAVPFADINGSILSNSPRYESLAQTMMAAPTDATHAWSPGILARHKDKVTEEVTLGWSHLIETTVRLVLGTCRRRKPGRGK
jgi:hypothetical protein